MKLYRLNIRNLILLLSLFLAMSCSKEKSNADEVLKILDSHEFISITPDTKDIIELYSEFEIRTDSLNVDYTENLRNSGQTTWHGLPVGITINNIQIFDANNNIINSSAETDEYPFWLIPSQSFEINSYFKILIDYSYNCPEAKYIHGIQRSKEFIFNTTDSESLPASMVICEYPLERQYNFLQGEYEYGFLKTTVKPDFLNNKQLKVRITNIITNDIFEKQMVYDEMSGILKYKMPLLENNAIYKIEYFQDNKELFRSNYFKTSLFNKFSEKINNIFQGEHSGVTWSVEPCFSSMTFINFTVLEGEPLDYYEQILSPQIGSNLEYDGYDFPKLLTVEIDTMKTNMNRFGYSDARELGFSVNRSTEYLGYIPINDFFYILNYDSDNSYYDIKLEDDEIDNASLIQRGLTSYIVKSYIAGTINSDMYSFKNQAANSSSTSNLIDTILNLNICNGYKYQKYFYKMKYVIPGIEKVCFTGEYEIGPAN